MKALRCVTAAAGAPWEAAFAALCGARVGVGVVARCADPGELRASLALDSPDVVVVDAAPDWLDAVLLDAVRSAGATVVVVSAAGDPRPARLGCRVVVDASRPEHVLDAVVAAAPGPRGRVGAEAVRAERRGAVVAVWGPKGGTGRTTIAVNVSWEVALAGVECTLVDADTTGGSVALALGLAEVPSLAGLVQAAGRGLAGADCLDAFPRPIPGLSVVPGSSRPADWPEVRDADLLVLLHTLRRMASVTVVDVGACLEDDDELLAQAWPWRRNQAARAVLGDADVVVAVVGCDPASARHAVVANEDLADLVDPARVVVVVTKVQQRRRAADEVVAQLERRCGWKGGSYLAPLDDAAFGAAWTGSALAEAAPGSPLRRCVGDIARGLAAGLGKLPRAGLRTRGGRTTAVPARAASGRGFPTRERLPTLTAHPSDSEDRRK